MDNRYTVEDLLTDDTFTDYCLHENSVYKAKWDKRLRSNEQLRKTADEARQLLGILSPALPQHEIDAEVEKLREYLLTDEDHQPQVTGKRSTRKILLFGFSLLILLTAGVYLMMPRSTTIPAITKFETRMGERKQYLLPDGSTVILNSNSNFSFDQKFGNIDRQIEMTGDAFFKVAKNPSKPFIVKSNGFSTTAIGTAFYVHTGISAADYRVDLLEGEVKLEKNTSGEISYLTAGQKASWANSSSSFTKQQYDTLTLNKWVKGILSFNNTPVTKAFEEMENWYSVQIEDRRSHPGDISINGDYLNAPLEDVIKIICFSLSCNYYYEENKIIIQ